MAVWSDALDDYEPGRDRPLGILGLGGAAVYHEESPDIWSGPTDFYITDYRAPLAPTESKTWTPIHLWANPLAPPAETMILSIEASSGTPPPPDRDYTLELLFVPEGIEGAPPVGSSWKVPPNGPLMVEVPYLATYDGLEGYRFAFTAGPAPDPCTDLPPADANCDGLVDFFDIDAFVAAITGGEIAWADYLGGSPSCDFLCANDINADGYVDFFDLDPFVTCITQGCP